MRLAKTPRQNFRGYSVTVALMNKLRPTNGLFWCLGMALGLSACSSAPPAGNNTASVAPVLPPGVFAQMARERILVATPHGPAPLAPPKPARKPSEPEIPSGPAAWLYASLASQTQLVKDGTDPSSGTRVWETFLRKYKIPLVRISQAEALEKIPPNGVLILPSVVALNDAERAAIRNFRERGGSVLSTWLTGVRSESGAWVGFDFMDQVLNVKVTGNTEETEDDNFMIVHGDTPIFHDLAPGTRVWLERVKNAYPLRLSGKQEAAQIMSWGRAFEPKTVSGLVSYDETPAREGRTSRSVTLGYPEQLWAAANPRQIELLAYSSLVWLFRQPEAYIANWPHPYTSAGLMAIQAAEEVADVDLDFVRKLEKFGGKATFYVHAGNIAKAAPMVKRAQSRGHEIAYFGDKFEGFAEQSEAQQTQRLQTMRQRIAEAGVKLPADAGFAAPLDAYDKTTLQLMLGQRVSHFISFMDATEARVPFFPTDEEDYRRATVILPRTMRGPEEAIEEGDPDDAMDGFLKELQLSERMASLSVIRLPAQSLLTPDQRDQLAEHLQERKDQVWLRSAGQIAQWWRDRSRISVQMGYDGKGLLLKATVVATYSPKEPVGIWVNLPRAGMRLRLESPDPTNPLPPVAVVDPWRSAVLLEELVPGEYHWYLHFDPPAAKN